MPDFLPTSILHDWESLCICWCFARGTVPHIAFYLTVITMDRIPVLQVSRRMRAGSLFFLPVIFLSTVQQYVPLTHFVRMLQSSPIVIPDKRINWYIHYWCYFDTSLLQLYIYTYILLLLTLTFFQRKLCMAKSKNCKVN